MQTMLGNKMREKKKQDKMKDKKKKTITRVVRIFLVLWISGCSCCHSVLRTLSKVLRNHAGVAAMSGTLFPGTNAGMKGYRMTSLQ